METVDRKGDSLRNEAGTSKQGPEQQPPILEPFFSCYPQENNGLDKCNNIIAAEMKQFFPGGDVFPQECPHPFVVVSW